ncbi:MAG: TolC family protein [Chitinophagia bacterium]|nr:TolC family protein [Chitinophagia bacterium]
MIKAKTKYAEASKIAVQQAKRENLPNFSLSAQQDFGTVNGQFGPLFGFNGLGVASSGPALAQQNNNAAFGASYLTNFNWDFFAFGKAKQKVKVAEAMALKDSKDLDQELFQHKIKIAAAYLNLIAAQQLKRSYEKNLNRADTFRRIAIAKVLSGMIPGVDSSQANAEYSSAKILLTKSIDQEASISNQLFQLVGIAPQTYSLDSFFINRIPKISSDSIAFQKHPLLQFYKSRINASDAQSRFIKKSSYPVFTAVGVVQGRGSGFKSDYLVNPLDFTKNYWSGISPTRSNYLLGVGVTWNITQPLRISQQVKFQNLISKGLQEEYILVNQQITAQLQLSDIKIKNALLIFQEAPMQIKAATDAYIQKSVLYKNGLTNLVDLTQTLYVLVRAETDRDISYNNVWQALLLKAASAGDFSLFENQF